MTVTEDIDISVTAPDGRKIAHQVQGEPVGEWLAVTPELAGDPDGIAYSGRWTVTHRPSGRNAAASSSWRSVEAARAYAAEADALGADVWGRADLMDGWFGGTSEGRAAREKLWTAIWHADQLDPEVVVPIGHAQPEQDETERPAA